MWRGLVLMRDYLIHSSLCCSEVCCIAVASVVHVQSHWLRVHGLPFCHWLDLAPCDWLVVGKAKRHRVVIFFFCSADCAHVSGKQTGCGYGAADFKAEKSFLCHSFTQTACGNQVGLIMQLSKLNESLGIQYHLKMLYNRKSCCHHRHAVSLCYY